MQGINPFDTAVMGFIQENFHNAVTDFIFPIITYLGEGGAVWIAIAVVLLFFRKTRKCGLLMGVAMLCGLLLGEYALKNIIGRVRPCNAFPNFVEMLIEPPDSYSFPSGHSCSSFAAATVISMCYKRWAVPALLLASLIAFSRVFLFVHYPTDVLAGAALGVFLALLTVLICRKCVEPKLQDKFANK